MSKNENPMIKMVRRKKQVDNGLIMIEKDKCRITISKPTRTKGSILELNKG